MARYLLPRLAEFHLDPSGQHALDFGCRIGRLSAALARRFKAVTAFDISGEMLLRGRAYLSELQNINVDAGQWRRSPAVGGRQP